MFITGDKTPTPTSLFRPLSSGLIYLIRIDSRLLIHLSVILFA
jgi:hypothetical protein